MSCFVCQKSVIVRVRDGRNREFCGIDHREFQANKDLQEHFRELELREEAARLGAA
jgi:hypothetical protein